MSELFTCDDEILIDPIEGSLGPQSSVLIKVTYVSPDSQQETNILGEIPIEINWIEENDLKNTLFYSEKIHLRIHKTVLFEHVDSEYKSEGNSNVFEAILHKCIKDILTSPLMDEVLDTLQKRPKPL